VSQSFPVYQSLQSISQSIYYWYVCFSGWTWTDKLCFFFFSFSSKYFPISLMAPSLTHGLWISMLFNFWTFGNFPGIFCYWYLNHWGQRTYSGCLTFIETLFFGSAYLSICFTCTGKNVYSAVIVWNVL
jgi:hypothetical protein